MTKGFFTSSSGLPIDLPQKLIERISAYRRQLARILVEGKDRIYSHELAALEGATAAQVRRDIMTIGYTGSPAKGYDVAGLISRINDVLDPHPHDEEGLALVGVGQLGKALLAYLAGAPHNQKVVAAFDVDPEKTGRVIHGCRCYGLDEIERVVAAEHVRVGVITVPATAAQQVADRLVRAGVGGLVNFAPARLRVPPQVYVEDVDISVLLEKVAFLARTAAAKREKLA
jgi:redox-sensing transcriptional repressor